MLNCLEVVHEAGCTYNDVKLDNFLIGSYPYEQNKKECRMRLIDFGFADFYIDGDKKHIKQ